LIDLSRMPSHGRYVAAWVRGSKSIRHIPIVFVDGDPAKVEAIRREIPDATYTTQARVVTALKRAKPVKDPVTPRQMMETDPSRTAAQKLGIREGAVVGLIDPPADYEKVLGKLPAGVVLEEDLDRECGVTLWFVHDPGEYEAVLPARRVLAARSRLWILWQKGRGDGLNGNFVRQSALAMGLVDYKICSVDSTWSGMLFAVKKAQLWRSSRCEARVQHFFDAPELARHRRVAHVVREALVAASFRVDVRGEKRHHDARQRRVEQHTWDADGEIELCWSPG
jgi:hypothetical protein